MVNLCTLCFIQLKYEALCLSLKSILNEGESIDSGLVLKLVQRALSSCLLTASCGSVQGSPSAVPRCWQPRRHPRPALQTLLTRQVEVARCHQVVAAWQLRVGGASLLRGVAAQQTPVAQAARAASHHPRGPAAAAVQRHPRCPKRRAAMQQGAPRQPQTTTAAVAPCTKAAGRRCKMEAVARTGS